MLCWDSGDTPPLPECTSTEKKNYFTKMEFSDWV